MSGNRPCGFRRAAWLKAVSCLLIAAVLVMAVTAGEEPTSSVFIPPQYDSTLTALELASSRYAQYRSDSSAVSLYDTEGYRLVGENQEIALYLSEEEDAIRLVDVRNGYVWGGASSEGRLNKNWRAYADSIVGIEFYNEKLVEGRTGLSGEGVNCRYTAVSGGFSCDVEMTEQQIAFSFSVVLTDEGLRFQMRGDSLSETGGYRLKSLSFFPFLGSSLQDEVSGYVFVPDGPGALIPFQKKASYLTGFDKKVYGDDLSIDTGSETVATSSRPGDYISAEPTVMLPVLGIVHGVGQNALFFYIESGAEFASVTATPSGLTTDYTWACMRFNFRQKYMQPINKEHTGVLMPQENANAFDINMTLRLLYGEDADYAGMARLYRGVLLEEGTLSPSSPSPGDIPLLTELLGADVKEQFLINGTQVLTTAAQGASILEELGQKGVGNITAILRGFTEGGVNGGRLTSNTLDSRLGKSADYEALRRAASVTYLYNNPMTANENQITLKGQAGIALTKEYICTVRQNSQLLFPETYYYSASLLPDRIREVLSLSWEAEPDGIALEGVGTTLYGDFTRDEHISRELAAQQIAEALASSGSRTALYGANLYSLPWASALFSLPMTCSQYLFETDTVPFLQMVLAGSLSCYAPWLNTGSGTTVSLLKMIEFGMYPAYILTWSESSALLDTPSSDLFSTCFEDWKDEIVYVYQTLNAVLSECRGMAITDHAVLEPGRVRVVYEGEKPLYINYTDTSWNAPDGTTVSPLSAAWGEEGAL